MRKLLTLTLLISLFAMPALALDFAAKSFYIQGEVTFPTGDFGDIASLGYGGGLGMMVPHNENISFGLEASYLTYSMEDIEDENGNEAEGVDTSASMIPVLVLMNYNMTDSPVYLLGGIGAAFTSAEVEFDDPAFADFEVDDSSTEFAGVLGVGFDATPNLFFEGRYMLVSDANQAGLHIGYRF